ncbi:MAG: peptidylprolyl isomerase [Desulfuromonadaceae bacterium]|nr:peptidylprolyl isomerase [Desulfuromonadaceae bacterium]
MKTRCGVTLYLFLLAWLIIALLSACRKQEEPASSVLVRVNERVISFDRFEADFARHLIARGIVAKEAPQELKRSFLAQKINRELILSAADRAAVDLTAAQREAVVAAHRKDYAADDFEAMLQERKLSVAIWRRQLLENRRIEEVISRLAYNDIVISKEAVAAYYQQHRADFDRPQQVRARQITLAKEADGQQVLGRLRQGLDFAEAARRFSISPDAEQGGDLGFFGRGQMPDVFDVVVFELTIGRISELVKSEYGYHLFLVEERRSAQRLTLDQVQDQIAARLRAEKEEQAYRNWLQSLRSQATIEVDWTLL